MAANPEQFEIMNAPVAGTVKGRHGRFIIRTDLYAAILHENRLGRQTVQESPAKVIVMLAVVFLVAGAAHYFYLSHQLNALRPQADELVSKADFARRDLENAKLRIVDLRERVAKRDQLMKFAKSRNNWGPVLEGVFACTPAYIELTAVKGTAVGQPQGHVLLNVSGRTATRNSRLDCDKYRLLVLEALTDAGIQNAEAKFTRMEEADPGAKTVGNSFMVTEFTIQLSWNQ
jgi:hypothetical protein